MGCTQSHAVEAPMIGPGDCTEVATSQVLLDANSATTTARNSPSRGYTSGSSGYRDVFSIFGEHGMTLETQDETHASPKCGTQLCSPLSVSGSVYSTATTASDTERSHFTHGPSDQCIPALKITYGAYSDKGMRKINEDRTVCTTHTDDEETTAYFGVYDGHGGPKVAEYLSKHLHKQVFDRLFHSTDAPSAMGESFAAIDDRIFHKQVEGGSTALTAVVRGRDLIVACAGDSQAVLSVGGKARALSAIHSPESEGEKERILAAKGVVVNGRIFGLLSVSRAFGDNDFKTSRGEYKGKFSGDLVTAVPDVHEFTLESDDEFLVMGCDGLFEVMDAQQVVEFVRAKLAQHGDVQHVCEELVSYAISIGSTDNVSAVVVCFNQSIPNDRTEEEPSSS